LNRSGHPHLRAIFYALGGFTCWVTSDTLLKLTSPMLVPKFELMAISSIGGMMIIYAFVFARREVHKLRPHKWRGLMILGLLHLINFSFWIMALGRLPLANLYTVVFMSPVVVSILAALFLREHMSWKHGLAIATGFAGVAIAVNPEHLLHDPHEWKSYGYVFASMLVMSLQMLTLRVIGQRESRECAAFYPRIVILAGTLSAGVLFGFTPISPEGFFLAAISGAIGSLGWLFMAHAYKLAPIATVAPFHYSEIVTGALLGYLIWHDVPSAHLLTGAVIIIASGLYIITHARKSAKILKEETHN
jgi:drug/metabolite transporter (DMT)-like permease